MTPGVPAHTVIDSAAVQAAASIAEEALACHRAALSLLAEGWQSETGSAIAAFMDSQCGHGAEIVDALRRASGPADSLPDSWIDPGSDPVAGRTIESADGLSQVPGVVGPAIDPAEPVAPPAPLTTASVPSPAASWTGGPAPVSPWAAPAAGDAPWAAAPGPGGPPALPDLGGVLVGLVAEIAQALGSYADLAPTAPAGEDADAEVPDPPDAARDDSPTALTDVARDDLSTTLTDVARDDSSTTLTDAGLTDAPVPGSAAVPEVGPGAPGSAPAGAPAAGPTTAPNVTTTAPPAESAPPQPLPAELLAAERPPDVGATAPAPASDGSTAPPAATPDAPPFAGAAESDKSPCEIAADELPKVGE